MAHVHANRLAEAPQVASGPHEQFRIEADVDLGVTSRVLDMLSAVDRFPTRLRLDRDNRAGVLSLEVEIAPGAANLAARIGQIPGVRRIEPLDRVRP